MNLPTWLQETHEGKDQLPLPSFKRSKKRSTFIAKTLNDISQLLQEGLFAEELALKKGFLQALNPKVKLLSLFCFLLATNLVHHLSLIIGSDFILLFVAFFSGLSIRHLLKRVGVLVLLFGVLPVLPSLLNWIRPGMSLLIIHEFSAPIHWGPFHFPATLALTEQGLWGALLFITRLGTSISLVAVLTLTTRWHELLGALRSFFIPKIFVMTLEMTYRYIHVLILSVEELLLARKARDAGASSTQEQHRFVASALGNLFSKTLGLSEEVYFSMLARGYDGEPHSTRAFRLTFQDFFAMALVLLSSLTLIVFDKALGG